MRDIKFKVWDKTKDKFICAYNHQLRFTLDIGQIYINGTNFTDDFILCQYTGLKDKNGVEIYEGDIVAHMSTRRAGYQKNGVTIYSKIVYGGSNPDNSVLTAYMGFWAVSLNDEYIECGGSIEYQTESLGAVVIGNIYENPELIKELK